MKETIKFEINGSPTQLSLDPNTILMWAIRNDLKLTGTKFGCGMGFCGSCTVIVDGIPERSCQFPLSDVQGKEVLTIEGLMNGGELHPLQEAFVERGALQCGFCTPGMIMNAYALLLDNPAPTRGEIIDGMEDNLCRCAAHKRIVEAIEDAARKL